jgi:hypothetical protein
MILVFWYLIPYSYQIWGISPNNKREDPEALFLEIMHNFASQVKAYLSGGLIFKIGYKYT